MTNFKVYQKLAFSIAAYNSFPKDSQSEWKEKHLDTIYSIEESLPHGSGINKGTKVMILPESKGEKITLYVEFHHMDENGFYCGWTEHNVIVTPSFSGFNIRITGRNFNQIKDYLSDVYHDALNEVFQEVETVS